MGLWVCRFVGLGFAGASRGLWAVSRVFFGGLLGVHKGVIGVSRALCGVRGL